jgi:hypothetical protein
MKRVMVLVMGLMILFSALTACSSSSTPTHAATSAGQTAYATTTVTPTASMPATHTASPMATSCEKAGTRKIPKARLLADLGLAYGAFHRYLYTPYKAGSFSKGAHGRTKAIIKAGLATAAIVKLLSNASKNAAADPTLCKFVPTIDSIKARLSSLGGKVESGTATSSEVDSTSGVFDTLKGDTGFTPPSNSSLPGLG